ncbi:MAG: prolyl oligopeptidase family serine peptidase [Rhodomicrobium sp.]
MTIDARPTIEAPDDDPWIWLEDIDGQKATAWADGQTATTLAQFGGPRFEEDRDTLKAILDRPDNIPYIARRGGLVFNFWKDADHPRGLWRATTLDKYRAGAPDWDVLLDIDRLAAEENEDWIWQGAVTLPPRHELALISLSPGGGDAAAIREFDIRAKAFVAGGFVIPQSKGGADWLGRDALIVSSALGEGMATSSGYARTIRVLQRGQEMADAKVVAEIPHESMIIWAHCDSLCGAGNVVFFERAGFFDLALSIGDRTGPKTWLDLPLDMDCEVHNDWLVAKPRSAWTFAGTTYPRDALLGIGLRAFIDGDRAFKVLFEPSERRALQAFFFAGDRLILSILDNLTPTFKSIEPGEGWRSRAIEGLPEIGVAYVWPFDADTRESNGDLVANVEGPATPPAFMLLEGGKSWDVLRRSPEAFSPDGIAVSRHEAISVDGARIPYFQFGPQRETGDAPVHLYGYGGFGVSFLPDYQPGLGKLWLERGGTRVIANIRGGGEFGVSWHDAGRREGKALSHEDFAAVAADLVARGVTAPNRIAAEGGSNGGILITNMLVRYPERFGALLCTVPLIDMRRYTKLLAGASWIAEYGDPDDPEDWAFLQKISAYHRAVPGQSYPPILIATRRRDDRVHPGHARKMTAKLQAMGYDAHLYEQPTGGHGAEKDNKDRAAFTAIGLAFLREKIGWRGEG